MRGAEPGPPSIHPSLPGAAPRGSSPWRRRAAAPSCRTACPPPPRSCSAPGAPPWCGAVAPAPPLYRAGPGLAAPPAPTAPTRRGAEPALGRAEPPRPRPREPPPAGPTAPRAVPSALLPLVTGPGTRRVGRVEDPGARRTVGPARDSTPAPRCAPRTGDALSPGASSSGAAQGTGAVPGGIRQKRGQPAFWAAWREFKESRIADVRGQVTSAGAGKKPLQQLHDPSPLQRGQRFLLSVPPWAQTVHL